jgi:hypothetical protein
MAAMRENEQRTHRPRDVDGLDFLLRADRFGNCGVRPICPAGGAVGIEVRSRGGAISGQHIENHQASRCFCRIGPVVRLGSLRE